MYSIWMFFLHVFLFFFTNFRYVNLQVPTNLVGRGGALLRKIHQGKTFNLNGFYYDTRSHLLQNLVTSHFPFKYFAVIVMSSVTVIRIFFQKQMAGSLTFHWRFLEVRRNCTTAPPSSPASRRFNLDHFELNISTSLIPMLADPLCNKK